MKSIVFILLMLCGITKSFGQIGGVLMVTVAQNRTGSLNDNIILDEVKVIISNTNYSKTCTLKKSGEDRWNCIVPSGYYNLKCFINDSTEIIVEQVVIRSDRLTFVEILDEPKRKLKYFEKRKRRKRYANMKSL